MPADKLRSLAGALVNLGAMFFGLVAEARGQTPDELALYVSGEFDRTDREAS